MVGHSSFTNIRAAKPVSRLPSPPPSRLWNHFFGFQLRLQNWTRFQYLKIQPKSLQNRFPDPSKTAPKRRLILQTPKIKNNGTLLRFLLIFDVPKPLKIDPKSTPKRLQKRLRLGYPLGTSKNTIFDAKTSPSWLPSISDFSKNR